MASPLLISVGRLSDKEWAGDHFAPTRELWPSILEDT